jgi:HK97 gp10 family phage protein
MGHYVIDASAMSQLGSHVDPEVRRLADEVFAESQTRVPVDTGALKRSGFVDGNDSEYRIGYGDPAGPVDYARYVEFGTSHMDEQPFLTPSALRDRGEL